MEKAFIKPYEQGWASKPAENSWVTPQIMDNYDQAINEIDNRVIAQSEDLTQFSNDGFLSRNKYNKANYANVFIGTDNKVYSSSAIQSAYALLKPNTTYTIQKKKTSRFIVGIANGITTSSVGTFLSNNANLTEYTFTTTSAYTYVIATVRHNTDDASISLEEVLNSIQIEEGTSATPYTPYAPSNIELKENFSQLVNYSTNEVAIGKWIDGKTIYRRVINVGHVGSNAVVNVATISGITEIVRLYGKAKANDYAQQYPLPFLSLNASFDIVILIQSEYVQIRTGSGFGDTGIDNVVIVAEYTK